MGRQRREFGPECKDEAVEWVINTDRTVAVVARELGIQESTLGRSASAACSRVGSHVVTGCPYGGQGFRTASFWD